MPVRRAGLAALDSIDIDTLLDKTIESIQTTESEIEQFRPRIQRAHQAMEDALDIGEYQARSLVIRPALVDEVDRRIRSIREAQSAKVRGLLGPPRLAALRSDRKSLSDYRLTIAEKRRLVEHYSDGARRACLALVSGAASDTQQVAPEVGR